VNADAAAIVRVWTGAMTFAQAVRSGGLRSTCRAIWYARFLGGCC
jgi:hypothetical protein